MESPLNAEVSCADGGCGETICVKDVSIPVDQIERIEADTIYLKLDKHPIGPGNTERRTR